MSRQTPCSHIQAVAIYDGEVAVGIRLENQGARDLRVNNKRGQVGVGNVVDIGQPEQALCMAISGGAQAGLGGGGQIFSVFLVFVVQGSLHHGDTWLPILGFPESVPFFNKFSVFLILHC